MRQYCMGDYTCIMTIYDILPNIDQIPIFSAASKENISQYLHGDKLNVREFASGEVIYSPASDKKCVGIMISGAALVKAVGIDDKTLLKTKNVGELFGIANLYTDDASFPSIIIANKNSKVLFISEDAFKAFIENDASALKCYLSILSKKIVYLNRKIATFTAGTAECKLAIFLFENSVNDIYTPSESMSALANMLGLGRASLYRALDKLIELKLIRREGADIVIINRSELTAFVYDSSL